MLCYGRSSLVWAVLKMLQFTLLWHSYLPNAGALTVSNSLSCLFVRELVPIIYTATAPVGLNLPDHVFLRCLSAKYQLTERVHVMSSNSQI